MYSTYNEGKSVVVERFIRTLKNNIYMTATGKNVYYDVLEDVVNEYNNTKHKDSRFKVGDRVRISKFKNIFAKGYTPN